MDDEERYLFETQGYLIVPNALSRAEVARLNDSVDASPKPRAAAGFLPQLTALLAQESRVSRPFRELLDHRSIAPRLDEILGEGHRLDMEPVGIVMEAGDEGGPLHGGGSDRASFAQSAFWHAGRFYTGMVTVEFFLTPQGPGDGGLGIISGSHKAELPLPASMNGGGAAHKAVTQILAAAGDAVIFAEACAHITLPWRAEHQRRVLLFLLRTRLVCTSVCLCLCLCQPLALLCLSSLSVFSSLPLSVWFTLIVAGLGTASALAFRLHSTPAAWSCCPHQRGSLCLTLTQTL